MKDYQIQKKDIELLRSQGMSEPDIAHSIHVAQKALEIAKRTGAELDMELVGRGALFHDLGKTVTHEIRHGLIGAEKGAELGLPPEITAVMEKHIRGGLTEAEAIELGLPVKDYTLHRLEERIIIYADRIVDIIDDGIVKIENEMEAETRFKEILRDYIKYGKNDITRERYYAYHDEIQGLISGALIDANTLKKKLSSEKITIVDVRRKADRESDASMIPGAVWHDPERVDEWANELPLDQPLVIYCVRGGSVSKSVSKKLQEKGIKVAYLHGGLAAWRANEQHGGVKK